MKTTMLIAALALASCKGKRQEPSVQPAGSATSTSPSATAPSQPPTPDPAADPTAHPSEAECRALQVHVFEIGDIAAELAAMSPEKRAATLDAYAQNVDEAAVKKCVAEAKKVAVACMMKATALAQLPGCVPK